MISLIQLIDSGIAPALAGDSRPSWRDFPPERSLRGGPQFQPFELAIPRSSDNLRSVLAENFNPLKTSDPGLEGAAARR